jgi:DNA-binding CsgD family transcriptional regulator
MRTLRDRYASLSGREREVMALVAAGLLNKQVGSDLGISEITVKAHRGRMMQKMKADSLADLVNMAARLGLARAQKALWSLWEGWPRDLAKPKVADRGTSFLYCPKFGLNTTPTEEYAWKQWRWIPVGGSQILPPNAPPFILKDKAQGIRAAGLEKDSKFRCSGDDNPLER